VGFERSRLILEEFLDQLPRRKKQAVAVLADCIALPLALWTALALRLGELDPNIEEFWPAFVVSSLVCIPVFGFLGLYRHVVRHMGNHTLWAVIQGTTICAVIVATTAYMARLEGFPRSVPVIFWMLTLLYVSGSRWLVRAYFEWSRDRHRHREAVIIYGAGRNGAELAKLLRQQGTHVPVAFLDDAPTRQKRVVDGLFVYPPRMLENLLQDTNARQILVAVGSSAVADRQKIIRFLEPFAVHVRLIPDLSDLSTGRLTLSNTRDVNLEDLLGRSEVDPLPHLLDQSVRDQCVLVTGAGGSIGGELCRQIIQLKPRHLILLDQSEYGLYQIRKELESLVKARNLDVFVSAVLGSVTNRSLIARTLSVYEVSTIYHAAAYKHVSLVEHNVIEGLKNNAFGTLYTAQAAIEAGVERFILISTDKAVRTTSIMGASKRVAEMTLQALQQETGNTRFSMVRFGNVLGSSGSVIPLFQEQIDAGGPVTVTHPDVTRYFMTLTEAAQLVLQAASMARGGDVFLLDMGHPVRIYELAEKMIRLKGHTVRSEKSPEGDIEIRITGLQPGEKLHEELLLGEAVEGTEHRKIMRAEERFIPWSELEGALNRLEKVCNDYDYPAIRSFIDSLVEGSDLTEKLTELKPDVTVLTLNPKRS
jgi:FlaA1/EpsC-like NDP-sugar epimerase